MTFLPFDIVTLLQILSNFWQLGWDIRMAKASMFRVIAVGGELYDTMLCAVEESIMILAQN